MPTHRKHYSAEFKAKWALEVLKGNRTLAEIASDAQVHPNLLMQWKKHLLQSLPVVFADKRAKDNKQQEEKEAQLYQQIGQLKVELDWLKKKWDASAESKRRLVETDHPLISITRQCQLLGLSRSGLYYQPRPHSELNLLLMRLIDQEYTAHPFVGYRKMVHLLGERGHRVNKKRVARLMHLMGLAAMVPGPNTSRPAPHNPVYPYLLRGVAIERVDRVWSCDITYLPMPKGFVYLFAVIDWFSRFVLSWEISTTLDTTFCLEGLERALCVGQPAIFNTDQGSQFTGAGFTSRLVSAGIALSMDGRGRALDNIFVERLWRTVKYEDVYLKGYATPKEVSAGLHAYFQYYNWERLHQALDYRTPAAMYYAFGLPLESLPPTEMHEGMISPQSNMGRQEQARAMIASAIKQHLADGKRVISVDDLVGATGMSEVTIRRHLPFLVGRMHLRLVQQRRIVFLPRGGQRVYRRMVLIQRGRRVLPVANRSIVDHIKQWQTIDHADTISCITCLIYPSGQRWYDLKVDTAQYPAQNSRHKSCKEAVVYEEGP